MNGIRKRGRFYETRIPPMLGMSHDTDSALSTIEKKYELAVRQFWLYEGRSLSWHGRQRGIHGATFESWILKGHEQLKAEFARRSARWRAQRAENQSRPKLSHDE